MKKTLYIIGIFFLITTIIYTAYVLYVNLLMHIAANGRDFCVFKRVHVNDINYSVEILEKKWILPPVLTDWNHINGGINLPHYRTTPPHFGYIIPNDSVGEIRAWSYNSWAYWGEGDRWLHRFSAISELNENCLSSLQSEEF